MITTGGWRRLASASARASRAAELMSTLFHQTAQLPQGQLSSIADLSLLSASPNLSSTFLIAHRLRLARQLAHLTQRQIAGERYSSRFISALEHGKARPSLETMQALARWLGLPVAYFVSDPVGGLSQLARRPCMGHWNSPRGTLLPQNALLRMLGEAEVLLRHRAADAALQLLGGTTPPEALSRLHHPRWYWLCGWALAVKRQPHAAMTCFEQGLTMAEALQEHIPPPFRGSLLEIVVRLRSFLGHLANDCNQSQQALAYVQPCLTVILDRSIDNIDLELGVYLVLGEASMLEGRLCAAMNYFEVALRRLDGLHRPLVYLRALWGLTTVHWRAGNLVVAKRYAQRVLALDLADRRILAAKVHALLGRILLRLGEHQQAERYLRQGLGGALRSGDPRALSTICGSYAEFYLTKKTYDRARALVLQGLEAREQLTPQVEGYLLTILAQIYQETNDQAAECTFQEAVRCLDGTTDQFLRGWAHETYANVLAKQRRFDEAYHHLCLANSAPTSWGLALF